VLLATFELPFPPSINKYWRRCGAQYFISKAGQAFRKNAIAIIFQVAGRKPIPLECNLSVEVDLYPPDRRKRDVDNTIKPTLDSLAHAGVMVKWL
jgi:crossover junction endodeoxyribonuclease RusA